MEQETQYAIPSVSIIGARRTDFVHVYTVSLSDVDQFKHMSFANYMRLMSVAADSLFASYLGRGYEAVDRMNLKNSKLHFKRQTIAGDVMQIRVSSRGFDSSSFTLYFEFVLEPNGEAIAEGHQTYEVAEAAAKLVKIMRPQLLHALTSIQDPVALTGSDVDPLGDEEWRPRCELYCYNGIKPFFKHTDCYGRVHPYYFAEWTSYVREAFFSEKCPDFRNIIASNIAMMTSKLSTIILEDSCFADPIQARLTVTRVKKVSFDVVIRFWNERVGKFAAYSKHTLVFMDPADNQFVSVPQSIRDSIRSYTTPNL